MTPKLLNRSTMVLGMTLMLSMTAVAANNQPKMPYVFEKFCFPCHKEHVQVGPISIMDMRSKAGNPLHEKYIRSNVRFGYNAMPAFRPSEVNDKGMDDIVSYLKGLAEYRTTHPDYRPEPAKEGVAKK